MQKQKKKPYVRPQVKKIRLDAKTSVLATCKTTLGAGPSPINGCVTPTPPCSAIGS
jgi:hypothetical protein